MKLVGIELRLHLKNDLNDGVEARQTPPAKKPYQKPAFRFGRVFETRALPREKITQTEDCCAQNRKSS